MLEQLRQQSRSFIIWILFGIIIVVFVISFGPQADANLGCGSSNAWVLKVKDKEVGQPAWRFAMNGLSFIINTSRITKPQRAEISMDMLLQRELLAQAAEANGFRMTADMVNERIAEGEWYILGYRLDGKGAYYTDGAFDFDRLESISNSLGLASVEQFITQQQREFLAESMKGLIVGSTFVSRDELLASYTHQHTTASVEYVKFRPSVYKRKLTLDDANIVAYLARHEAEIKSKYEADATTYKGVKPQALVRQIFIKREAPVPPTPAIPDPAEPPGDDPVEEASADPAQATADSLHAQLTAGGDFATLAQGASKDERSASKGGLLGWRTIERPGLGDPKLVEALAALEPDKLSPVIETRRGFYILRVDDKREGDLTFDQVKKEIASKLAGEYYAREGARRDAEAALAELKSGKQLDEMFERGQSTPQLPPGFDLEQLKQQLPPGTDVEEFLRQLQNNKQGSITVEGADIPATAKATGAKATGAKAAKAAAEPAPASESGAARAPADEEIPRPTDMARPALSEAGPFPRDLENVPGVGTSAELVNLVFDQIEVGELVDKVVEVDDGFVIVKLVAREEPDLDVFATTEQDIRRSHIGGKAIDTLQQWVGENCREVVTARGVSINKSVLSFYDDNNKPIPITYQPCQNL